MAEKTCPICESEDLNFLFKLENNNYYKELVYYKCNNCFYFFRMPDSLFIDYKNDYVSIDLINKSKKLAQNYFNYTKDIIIKNKNLLEIGGSLGYYCKIIKDNLKINCTNFELSDFALKYSKNIGIESTNDFNTLESNSFNNIVSFHVLEHIPPKEIISFFENLLEFLTIEGKIIIITPNASSNKLNLLKQNYGWLAPSEHIGFFDKRTILYIFNKFEKQTGDKYNIETRTKIPSFYHYPIFSFISKFRNNFNVKSSDLIKKDENIIQTLSLKNKIVKFLKSSFSMFLIIEKIFFIPFYLIFDIINYEKDELVIIIQKNNKN